MRTVFFGVLILLSFSASSEVIWSYGIDDNSQKGRNNAMEFSSAGGHTPAVSFYADYAGSPVKMGMSPEIYGYLDDDESFIAVCTRLGLPCMNFSRDFHAVEKITFEFRNISGKVCTGLVFEYHRHGSETDSFTYTNITSGDQDFFSPGSFIADREGFSNDYFVGIGSNFAIFPGDHVTIELEYVGGDQNNGHFIDYIALNGECEDII